MSRIRCPSCGSSTPNQRGLAESRFRWTCSTCGSGYEVRIVFLPRRKEVDPRLFRAKVEVILRAQGLTRSDLARLVGVTPAYISTILSGRRRISSEFAHRVLRALDTSWRSSMGLAEDD